MSPSTDVADREWTVTLDGKPWASAARYEVENPTTGRPLTSAPDLSEEEVGRAVAAAQAAQPAWAATNPQKRARVMMRFLELIRAENDSLAELLASEHGKTVPDAKGDIQRGVEVVEFACGIPHLLKGEYSDSVSSGIDVYSMRQPLGVCAGITPFNFPAMVPLWMLPMAIATGNTFVLKPSEKDPSCALDRKSTRLNSSHTDISRMPSSA